MSPIVEVEPVEFSRSARPRFERRRHGDVPARQETGHRDRRHDLDLRQGASESDGACLIS
jgi:hypothetical protein